VELPAAVERQLEEGSLLPEHLPLSARLERAFAARLSELPEASRALLLAAAADGQSAVEESIAATTRVLGRSVSADDLAPAAELRLAELEPPQVRFRHPLVRSAVYRAATQAECEATHLALAAVLADDPDRNVWHRAAAAMAQDETLAADLEASAERAQRRGAIATAATALQRSAELCDGPERVRRLLAAAQLGFELGRRDIALPLLAKAEPLELTPLERGRSTLIREMLDPRPLDPPKVRLLVEATSLAAKEGDRDLALDLLWLVASRCWWSFLGEEQRQAGLAAAEALGTVEEDERVLAIVAYLAPLERGDQLVAAISRASGSSERDPLGRGLVATAAFATGAFDLADAFLAATAARLRSQGRLGHLPRLLALQGTTGVRMPDWNVAIPAAEEGERLASELGQPAWIAGAQTVEAYVAALRGDEEAAEAAAAAAERVALPQGANFILTAVQWARGLAALGAGRHADAFEELRRTHDPQDPSFHHHMRWWAIADIAEAAVHSGNVEEGRRLVEELNRLAQTTPAAWIQLGLRHARAVLAEDEHAEALFQEALSAKVNRWPYQRARLLLAYGAWLRRHRRVAESRTPLRAARDAFDALGVRAWGERARQELRASGETSRSRTPEARDELTPQELQIAQMAAEGMTNREIGQQLYLSHRTVGSHLYRLFPKLGISSRGQLSAALGGD
jgi:DNA-binding CsgD family transcriptional regulator